MIPSAVFVPAIALQPRFSLSSKFLRNLGSMPKTSTRFVDFEKACDWVPRQKLCGDLREYSVDGRLLLAVKSPYSCSEVCVRVGRVKSRPFTVGVGLWQGCLLSPLLFIVYNSTWIGWTVKAESRRVSQQWAAGSIVYFLQTIWYC